MTFETLRVAGTDGILRVTLDHPPVNLLDGAMLEDLDRLSRACVDEDARVLVLDSADPEFLIAHADVRGMLGRGDPDAERRERLSRFAEVTERLRALPMVTIAVVEGRVRGGGSELILSLDLRYAARETAILGQPELALGLIPGGGATRRLPALTGRSRALEIMLGAGDLDAATAERYGWVTRALPAAELRPFVDALAARIAGFSRPAIAALKAAVDHPVEDLHEGLREEHRRFRQVLATQEATETLERFLAAGGQTRAYELLLGTWSLVSYETRTADGTRDRPLGDAPYGLLVYHVEGTMAARLARGADAPDAIAYRARFEVDEQAATVAHHVTESLEPTWVGHTLRRTIELGDGTLVLRSAGRAPDGSSTEHTISWRRPRSA